MQVVDSTHISTPFNSSTFGDTLLNIAVNHGIDIIAPASHCSIKVLDDNIEVLRSACVKVLLPFKGHAASTYLSKSTTASHFQQHGLKTPQCYTSMYPVFIRPDNGSGSKQGFICHDAEDVKHARKQIDIPFVQEYIEGDEYTIDIFSDFKANPICVVPRKRIEVRDGEVVKAVTVRDEYLIETCKGIAKSLGLVGMSCIQCIKRGDDYYFIEINPRFGGGITLSIHAGANIPLYLSRIMAGETLEYCENWREGVYMSRAYRDFYSE